MNPYLNIVFNDQSNNSGAIEWMHFKFKKRHRQQIHIISYQRKPRSINFYANWCIFTKIIVLPPIAAIFHLKNNTRSQSATPKAHIHQVSSGYDHFYWSIFKMVKNYQHFKFIFQKINYIIWIYEEIFFRWHIPTAEKNFRCEMLKIPKIKKYTKKFKIFQKIPKNSKEIC